jgi:3-hydroxybutyryl-CoA dehydrogenase
MENSDLVGIELTYNIHKYILKHLADNHEPSPLLQEMLARRQRLSDGKAAGMDSEQMKASSDGLKEYLIDCAAKQKK